MRTRDLLLTEFETESGDSLAVVVVHLPSKYGGGKTAWKRELAAERLCSVVDSVMENGTRDVVVMGDFNDGPQAGEFEVLKKSLVNVAAPGPERGGKHQVQRKMVPDRYVLDNGRIGSGREMEVSYRFFLYGIPKCPDISHCEPI